MRSATSAMPCARRNDRAMRHKRKKTRNARAGCKLCKPWKVNGFATARRDGEKFADHRLHNAAARDLRDVRLNA